MPYGAPSVSFVTLTTRAGDVLLERAFPASIGASAVAAWRAGLRELSTSAQGVRDDQERVALLGERSVVWLPLGGGSLLVFVGGVPGGADELELSGVARAVAACARAVCGDKAAPSESLLLQHHSKLCCYVDEVVVEGVVESTDVESCRNSYKDTLLE